MVLLLSAAFASCPDDVAAFGSLLDRWAADAESGRFGVAGLPPLVVRPFADAATGSHDGAVIVVGADGITVDGHYTRPEWVVVALQQNPNITFGMQRRDARYLHVTLAIAPDAPWSAVVAAVDGVRQAHLSEVLVVFETPPEVEAALAAPASSAHDRIAALDALPAEGRLAGAVDLMRGVLAACPAAGAALGASAGQFPENRPRYLAQKLPAALTSCGCAAAPGAVAEAFWYLDGRDRVYAVPVTLNARTLVALPPTMPWKDAWPQLIEARAGAQPGFPTP